MMEEKHLDSEAQCEDLITKKAQMYVLVVWTRIQDVNWFCLVHKSEVILN
jgi:hypothetical protein